MNRYVVALSCLALPVFAAEETAITPINLDAARQQFQAAQEICEADGGRLWGVSLCGPVMFVDPQSRRVVANQQDGQGALKEEGGVYTGSLPTSQNIASTATQWSGVLWSQIIWPLPDDASQRNTLLAHELFHRIQSQVPVPLQSEAANGHLDTLEGRYLMQLEWRALDAALSCTTKPACRQAVADALVFRAARYQLFPTAAEQEKSLELNEGVAEYTGVCLGNRTREAQVAAARRDLSANLADATFVRSFAYATGPAYGLLLDAYSPGWRKGLRAGPSFNDLLQTAVQITLPQKLNDAAAQRAQRYDSRAALRSVEVAREKQRQQILAVNRTKFVDGPVLVIPLQHASIQFDPRNLQPLEKLGTVYPTLRISADWGVLEVNAGALLPPTWSTVTVVAPISMGEAPQGEGWTLVLKPDWKVVPGKRSGDFTLVGPPQQSR